MTEKWQGFQVDYIADQDHELLAKYADFVQCKTLDPAGFHYYAIMLLRGYLNPAQCDLLPPPLQYHLSFFPQKPGVPHQCGILDNGVHVHRYILQDEEQEWRSTIDILRVIERVKQNNQEDPH